MLMPTVLVISDYPIVSATVEYVLQPSHRVLRRTWSSSGWHTLGEIDLVIVDVTSGAGDTVLTDVAGALPGARLVAFSLHTNEVHLYSLSVNGLVREGSLPSLLALSA